MIAQILNPKIHLPARRSGLVLRPRLLEKLDTGIRLGRGVTIISAPAGYGKTTLLSEWAVQCGRPVGWLSLDEEDNSHVRFLFNLVRALHIMFPAVSLDNVALLESGQPPPLETVLDTLVSNVYNALAETRAFNLPPVFIFDDYFVIESPSVHKAMSHLAEHLALVLHIMIASRNQPPLPLARLRIRGSIAELDADDLRFTPVEARTFFCETAGLELSSQDTNTLQARTEGWIAGMQVAALALEERKDHSAFIRTFAGSHRSIRDYLVDEVIKRQSPEIQDFMLATSVLDRMCGLLCDALLIESAREQSGQAILEFLESNNLFLVPLDDDRRWFRYHQLFAELLRNQLENRQPDRVAELYQRAAAWYEKNGMAGEAIKYYTRAGRLDQVALVLEKHADRMLTKGRIATLSQWLESVPEEFYGDHPKLALVWCLTDLHRGLPIGTIVHILGIATRSIEETPPGATARGLAGMANTVRGIVARRQGDNDEAVRLSQLALGELDPGNRSWRAVVLVTMGTASASLGNLEQARTCLAEASSISQATGNVTTRIVSAAALAKANVELGRLAMAVEICESTLENVEDHGDGQPVSTSELYWVLGDVHREWNDLDAASCFVQRAIHLGRHFGSTRVLVKSYLLLAQIVEAQHDFDQAGALLRKAERLGNEYLAAEFSAEISTYQARLWLKQNRLDLAARWAEEREKTVHTDVDGVCGDQRLTTARVLLSQLKTDEALAILRDVRDRTTAAQRHRCSLSAKVLLALAYQAAGRRDEALPVLGDVLGLAEHEGFVRLFADEGPAIRNLLATYAAQIEPGSTSSQARADYVERIIAAIDADDSKTSFHNEQAENNSALLTRREVEVLKRVASGQSNSEIALELSIALCTVKTHVVNIFGKLAVANRTQAVARARELRLLDA